MENSISVDDTSSIVAGTDKDTEFVQAFPWLEGIDEGSLSTTRGFVFQYPPFPTLPAVGDGWHAGQPSAALYLHVPFCPYRCKFCYYAVSLKHSAEETDAYLDVIEQEMQIRAEKYRLDRHKLTTVFIGGGTPTLLAPNQLQRLGSAIHNRFDCSNLVEFTVESDPTTLTSEKLGALQAYGLNRVSIGIQSFSTDINNLNNRKHTQEESLAAIDTVRQCGIDNINLDLICGLVGESQASWEQTLATLLSVAPTHITIYLLSVRPQTGLSTQGKTLGVDLPPPEAERIEMYLYARTLLMVNGYIQTTPNCFVRALHFEQVHQRNAWSSLPLLGFGNSAYSFMDDCVTQSQRSLPLYKKAVAERRDPVEIGKHLSPIELMVRYCVLRLKLLYIDRLDFIDRFGVDVMHILGTEFASLIRLQLVTVTVGRVELTVKGIIYVDDVCRTLYTEQARAALSRLEEAPIKPLRKSLI